jgi:hypothetical protein
MHPQPRGQHIPRWPSILHVRLTLALVLGSIIVAAGPPSASTRAQGPSPAGLGQGGSLVERLPAQVGGHAVRVDPTDDLGTWIDAVYQGETHPELETLDAALEAQGLTREDVRVAWASAGDDLQVQGFQLPGGDAAASLEAILGVYFLGFPALTRTEQEVAGHPVTFLTVGPLESDEYPFGVVTDGDTVWIASASRDVLGQALEALVGAADGSVPRYEPGAAAASPGFSAPWSWDGTVSETVSWDKGAYRGTAVGRHIGSWLQPLTTTRYCDDLDCVAYIPTGTIEWSWDVSAPTRPPCSASTRGSLAPGAVVVPADQMLFLDPSDDGHVRFWGSGTFQLPDQPCVGWESDHGPGSFLSIPVPTEGDPNADEMTDPYPSCSDRQWRVAATDTRITGRCWNYHEPGYEDVVEWDLIATEQ